MIIKGKRGNQTGSHSASKAEQAANADPHTLSEEQIPWSEEAVMRGELPERRTDDRRNDRRRSYRRIEDKNLISKAHEEVVAIKENAFEQGFHEGLQQAQESLSQLQSQIATLLKGREDALASVSDEIGALAVEVAARILKVEVSCDETLVMGLVKDTIQKMGRNTKSVLIKVHPDDVGNVRKWLKEDPIPNLNAELIVMEDEGVDAGSCIVETNSGLIDASFSTQLGILRQLLGGMRNAGETS